MPHSSDRAGGGGMQPLRPLDAQDLESALEVVEVVQSLSELDDVSEMLASLARNLTEILSADACMVSVHDAERGTIRRRAGYARPPFAWKRTPVERVLADHPRTAAVLRSGEPASALLSEAPGGAEMRTLLELGYRSRLMLRLPVEDEPFALIELFDQTPRAFSEAEIRLGAALALEAGKMIGRRRMRKDLEDAYIATVATLAAALEAKDAYTNDHATEIAELTGAVSAELGIPAAEIRMIRLAALLHDIGKIGIPEAILRKPGPLTEDEWQVMQEHPAIGARILEPVPYYSQILPLVIASHERFDGGGYPNGLAGDEIPLGARVIAVCDAYHAMIEDRVYRKAVPVEEALREIVQCSGTQFDPACVEAMLAVVRARRRPRFSRERLVRLAQHPRY